MLSPSLDSSSISSLVSSSASSAFSLYYISSNSLSLLVTFPNSISSSLSHLISSSSLSNFSLGSSSSTISSSSLSSSIIILSLSSADSSQNSSLLLSLSSSLSPSTPVSLSPLISSSIISSSISAPSFTASSSVISSTILFFGSSFSKDTSSIFSTSAITITSSYTSVIISCFPKIDSNGVATGTATVESTVTLYTTYCPETLGSRNTAKSITSTIISVVSTLIPQINDKSVTTDFDTIKSTVTFYSTFCPISEAVTYYTTTSVPVTNEFGSTISWKSYEASIIKTYVTVVPASEKPTSAHLATATVYPISYIVAETNKKGEITGYSISVDFTPPESTPSSKTVTTFVSYKGVKNETSIPTIAVASSSECGSFGVPIPTVEQVNGSNSANYFANNVFMTMIGFVFAQILLLL
ncbi:uncharacterized protein ASCRUDRAFT_115750 [Ascoidea rubescens DSM 1968]|uniref:Uncharacterized protein n=1 Tax=Ascoidea rubescens DSM 1968 TaxID=1344418 RepID=A0A1D2VBQ4_9ASCO|nr:hypothetical protein ASCRUDRAFT_115750 [Ascoidea rubescens DSM 1968]ODV59041.1 hypothetical protein ASCRUDRAFT_115750 [Ascoidea rubescens DSM 1968]